DADVRLSPETVRVLRVDLELVEFVHCRGVHVGRQFWLREHFRDISQQFLGSRRSDDDTVVAEFPRLAGILGHVGATRAYGDVDTVPIARVHLDRMCRRSPGAARPLPKLPEAVAVERIDGSPRLSPVLASEQARRLRPGVHDPGLARMARLDVPDVLYGDAHVCGKSEPGGVLLPRLAAVKIG